MAADFGPSVSTELPKELSTAPMKGQYVTLEVYSEEDAPSLWRNWGLPQNMWLFDYMPWPEMSVPSDITKTIGEALKDHPGLVIFSVKGDPSYVNPPAGAQDSATLPKPNHNETLGIIGYFVEERVHRALEVGAIVYGPALQRSVAATEAHYLLLRSVCDPDPGSSALPYRRIAWRCNKLNQKSRYTAERIGYVYEGTWRNHWIVKGRSRDTDWLSIIDEEWPRVKMALEIWMDSSNFDQMGRQKRTLMEVRASI